MSFYGIYWNILRKGQGGSKLDYTPTKPRQDIGLPKRISKLLYIYYFMLILLFLRFFYLQIVKGDYYHLLAEGNTEQSLPLIPPRGIIYDRKHNILAKNTPSYNLAIIPAYLPRDKKLRQNLLNDISEKFLIPYDKIIKRLEYQLTSYKPIILRENLSKKEIIFLEEQEKKYSPLKVLQYPARVYTFGESVAHLLGYVGIINKKELDENRNNKLYRINSIIGKTGIERYYDVILRGIEGSEISIVNTFGEPIKDLPEKHVKPVPGKNLVLSIDGSIQELAYQMIKGKRGIILITKPSTGEVIAFVSSPSYDPNLFIDSEKVEKAFLELSTKKDNPFFNRITQGKYAVGSIFKIITALSALEDGILDPYEKVDCSKGYFELGNRVYKDWKVHGYENLFTALQKSVNVYFYKIGYKLGYAAILDYSRKLGLTSKTGIDIPDEVSSFIPTPEWKEKVFKEIWYDGDTVNAAIGQGFITLTPLAVNNIISFVAADKLYKPRIVWEIRNPYTNAVEKRFQPEVLSNYQANPKNLEYIREGLKLVTQPGGTASYHYYVSKIPIAGKTGSAQNIEKKTHSWFTSYGPLDKPLAEQYAITVMVEASGHGGSVAVPIASLLYNFIEGKMSREVVLKEIYSIYKYQGLED